MGNNSIILPIKLKKIRWPLIHFALLIFILYLHEHTNFDFYFQQKFYLPLRHQWLVDSHAFWPKLIFYHGLKWGVILFGAWQLAYFISHWMKWNKIAWPKLQIILSLGILPIIVGILKHKTGVYCANELTTFGGHHPFAPIFPLFHEGGHCFPAGHASGGFALIALAFTRKKFVFQYLFWGVTLGWAMGIYQMLKGDHFMTHTLFSQELGFLLNYLLQAGISWAESKSTTSEQDNPIELVSGENL